MDTKDVARKAALAALDKKADDIQVYNLHDISSVTDFFVICTGSTDVHCRAIFEEIHKQLREHDIRPGHVEGKEAGRWILMDYFDFVVHIFQPEVRDFYGLERIWGDANMEAINDETHEG